MYTVYEQLKSDGKRFPVYQHKDRFDCEVWAENHKVDWKSVVDGKAVFVIED